MRAPPEAETSNRGIRRSIASSITRDFFTNNRAHAAAGKLELHHAYRQRLTRDACVANDDRVIDPGFLTLLYQLLRIGLRLADKVQGIDGDHICIHFNKAIRIYQKLDALV